MIFKSWLFLYMIGTVSAEDSSPCPCSCPAATSSTASVSIPERELGRITISSFPASDIYIDGKRKRSTPMFAAEIAPGSYQVQLVTPDGQTKSFPIEVTAGNTTKRVWNFMDGTWQ